jgi:hypothetical protein
VIDLLMTKTHTKEAIERYLQGLHVTLWLNWDITDKRERAEAVDYVYDLLVALEAA